MTVSLKVSISEEDAAKLRQSAAANYRDASQQAAWIIKQYLKRQKEK